MDTRTLAASATTGVCVAAIVVGVVRGAVPGDEQPSAAAATHREPSVGTGQAAAPDGPDAAAPPSPPGPATSPTPVVPEARPRFHDAAGPPWPGQPLPPPERRLPGDDAAALAELARELLIADATGAGRERFPGVWDEGPSRPCCRRVEVHYVSAGLHPGDPDAALVLVTWSAVDHHGQPTHTTVMPLAFTRTSEAGGWQPLPAWRADDPTRRRHGGRHGGPYGGRQGGRHRRRHGGRQRARHTPEVPGGNAAGQRPASGPRGDRHLLFARRRRSEPKTLHATVIAPATAGTLDHRAADLLTRLTQLAETIAALATLRTLLVATVTLAAIATAWVALCTLATRRALRPDRRVRLLALPTDTFDPTPEEVDRYAAQLARVRRTVRGRLDRPAHAVRLRLDSVAGGGCAYRIEGSAQAASILRLTGYAEVDLRPAGALDDIATPTPPAAPDGHDDDPPDPADEPRRSGHVTPAPSPPDGRHNPATAPAPGTGGTRHHPTSEETPRDR
jgi:hypothetical protein